MGQDEPRDFISRNRPRLSQARRRPSSKHSDKNANTSKTVDLPLPFGPIRTVSGVTSLRSILRSARKLRTLRDSIRGGPSGFVLAIRPAYPGLARTDRPMCCWNPAGLLAAADLGVDPGDELLLVAGLHQDVAGAGEVEHEALAGLGRLDGAALHRPAQLVADGVDEGQHVVGVHHHRLARGQRHRLDGPVRGGQGLAHPGGVDHEPALAADQRLEAAPLGVDLHRGVRGQPVAPLDDPRPGAVQLQDADVAGQLGRHVHPSPAGRGGVGGDEQGLAPQHAAFEALEEAALHLGLELHAVGVGHHGPGFHLHLLAAAQGASGHPEARRMSDVNIHARHPISPDGANGAGPGAPGGARLAGRQTRPCDTLT